MTLKELKPGQSGTITSIGEKGPVRRRLMEMGVTSGIEIKVVKVAPLGDPIEVCIRGYELSLRKEEANHIEVRLGD